MEQIRRFWRMDNSDSVGEWNNSGSFEEWKIQTVFCHFVNRLSIFALLCFRIIVSLYVLYLFIIFLIFAMFNY